MPSTRDTDRTCQHNCIIEPLDSIEYRLLQDRLQREGATLPFADAWYDASLLGATANFASVVPSPKLTRGFCELRANGMRLATRG